jgi:hypothetical protein
MSSTIINLSQIQPESNLLNYLNPKNNGFVLECSPTNFTLKNVGTGKFKGQALEMPKIKFNIGGKLENPLIRLTKNSSSSSLVRFRNFYNDEVPKKSMCKLFVTFSKGDSETEFNNFALLNYQLTQAVEIKMLSKLFPVVKLEEYKTDIDYIKALFDKYKIEGEESTKYIEGIQNKVIPHTVSEEFHILGLMKDQIKKLEKKKEIDNSIKELALYIGKAKDNKSIKENFRISDVEVPEGEGKKTVQTYSGNFTFIFKEEGVKYPTMRIKGKTSEGLTKEEYTALTKERVSSVILSTLDFDCRAYGTSTPSNQLRMIVKQFTAKPMQQRTNAILIDDVDEVVEDNDALGEPVEGFESD